MSERLVVIHNPNSTHGREVDSLLFRRLGDVGVRYTTLPSVSPDYNDNVHVFADKLEDGDRVIVAGGDGTFSQAFNAAILSKRDVTLAVEPFGNFNDAAAAFNGNERVIDPVQLASPLALVRPVVPMSVTLDDELWRYSPAYTTLGWTAAATDLFMAGELRESLKKQHKHLVTARSMTNLFREYYSRRRDMSLPNFSRNGDREYTTSVTDIVALNTHRMGRIIKRPSALPVSDQFAYAELNTSTLYKNAAFLARAILHNMPAEVASDQRIEFVQPQVVPIQTEGEFHSREMQRIVISKDHDVAVPVVTMYAPDIMKRR